MIKYGVVNQIYNDMDFLSRNEDEGIVLMHYTSTEVMDILLTKPVFRASHILYLNDAEEYYKGLKTIEKAVLKDGNSSSSVNDMFVISFSQEKDLLSQWITYAKESGVAIELDNQLLNLPEKENSFHFVFGLEDDGNDEKDKYKRIVFNTSNVLKRIEYIGDNIKEEFERELNTCYKKTCETAFSGMPLFAAYIKDESFSAEKETRAAFIYHDYDLACEEKSVHPKIHFQRTPKGILRPYFNACIMLCEDKGRNAENEYNEMLPLKSITVGPSGIQQTIFDSVVHRMKYGEKKVYDYSKGENGLQKRSEAFWKEVEAWLNRNEIIKADDTKKHERVKEIVLANSCNFNMPNHTIGLMTDDEKQIIERINRNFYFSKEGIIIRKSNIPYIF